MPSLEYMFIKTYKGQGMKKTDKFCQQLVLAGAVCVFRLAPALNKIRV